MQPGAELRIGTDIGDYLRTILLAMRGHPGFDWQVQGPADWRVRPPDWPPTRYEAKAGREGRALLLFTLCADARHPERRGAPLKPLVTIP